MTTSFDLENQWPEIKTLFKESFKSSFHFSIASVGKDGNPHITPIGSIILGDVGKAIYFEKFPTQLPKNIDDNPNISVLAVNSTKFYWLRSLISGKFSTPPAIRLVGKAGNLRDATQKEIELWQKRVRRMSFTKGHRLIWRDMIKVRELKFNKIEPVHIGEMTKSQLP